MFYLVFQMHRYSVWLVFKSTTNSDEPEDGIWQYFVTKSGFASGKMINSETKFQLLTTARNIETKFNQFVWGAFESDGEGITANVNRSKTIWRDCCPLIQFTDKSNLLSTYLPNWRCIRNLKSSKLYLHQRTYS